MTVVRLVGLQMEDGPATALVGGWFYIMESGHPWKYSSFDLLIVSLL